MEAVSQSNGAWKKKKKKETCDPGALVFVDV